MRQELVLRRQLGILRRSASLLALSVIAASVAAYVVSGFLPRVYESKTTLLVGQALTGDSPSYDQVLTSQRLSETYSRLATTRPIVTRVIERLRLEVTPAELFAAVTSQAAIDSLFVTITVRGSEAARTSDVANAFADELIAASRQVILAAPDAGATNLLSVVEPAIPGEAPVSPRTLMNTILAAVVGLMLASAVVFSREFLGDRVNAPDDVRAMTGFALLSEISNIAVDSDYEAGDVARAPPDQVKGFRALRTQVERVHPGTESLIVAITSSSAGEGASIVAAGLAVMLAQEGRRTVLVDANVMNPAVHQMFGSPNTAGLSTLLESPALTLDTVAYQTVEPNLRIVASGPIRSRPGLKLGTLGLGYYFRGDTEELFTATRIERLLALLREEADVVIVDCPPVLTSPQTAILARSAGGCVYVVAGGSTIREDLRSGSETLAASGAHVWGFVFLRPVAWGNRVRRRVRRRVRELYPSRRGAVS